MLKFSVNFSAEIYIVFSSADFSVQNDTSPNISIPRSDLSCMKIYSELCAALLHTLAECAFFSVSETNLPFSKYLMNLHCFSVQILYSISLQHMSIQPFALILYRAANLILGGFDSSEML